MIYDVKQSRKTAIVIKPAFGVCPKAVQRCGAIAAIWRTVGLKIVNADIRRQMHVPSWLSHQRLGMATAALTFAVEHFLAACGGGAIKTARGGAWRRK